MDRHNSTPIWWNNLEPFAKKIDKCVSSLQRTFTDLTGGYEKYAHHETTVTFMPNMPWLKISESEVIVSKATRFNGYIPQGIPMLSGVAHTCSEMVNITAGW